MKTTLFIISVLFTSLLHADLNNSEFTTLQNFYNKNTTELNRKYAEKLTPLLDKATKSGNTGLANEIRQELAKVGFPAEQDWVLGQWSIEDNDGGPVVRSYEFYSNGTVKYLGRSDNLTISTSVGTTGPWEVLKNGSIKATLGELTFVLRRNTRDFTALRWKTVDYGNDTKAIPSTKIVKAK